MDSEAVLAHPLFDGCAPQRVEALAALGERLSYGPGDTILRQGEPAWHVFVLLTGVVRVLISSEEGHQITAKLFKAPAVFGEMEALTATPFIESVEVMRRATVLRFSVDAFEEVMAQDGRVTRNLLVDVCHRFRVSAQNQAFAAFENVERRLANLLLSYARTLGTKVAEGIQLVGEGLTQEAMAQGIGVNEKSVRRTLRDWEGRGLILRRGRSYVLARVDALAELAGAEPPRLDYSSAPTRRTPR